MNIYFHIFWCQLSKIIIKYFSYWTACLVNFQFLILSWMSSIFLEHFVPWICMNNICQVLFKIPNQIKCIVLFTCITVFSLFNLLSHKWNIGLSMDYHSFKICTINKHLQTRAELGIIVYMRSLKNIQNEKNIISLSNI